MRFFRLRDVGAGVGAGAACFVLVGSSFTWSQFSAHGWTQTPGLLLPSLPRFPRPRPRRGPRQAHFALRLPRACNAVVVQLSSAGADFGEDDLAALRKKREAILAKKKAWARKAADDASSAAAAAAGEGKGEGGESNETGKAAAPPPPPPSGSPATPARASVAAPPPSPSRPRPARKAPSPAPPTRGGTSPSPSPAPQAKGLDYAADYPDENDLHIPNRIGFGTQSWGDESRGFVSQGRLTKKMVKRGRFVPGDLQVAYNTLLECGIQFIDTSERYGDRMRSKQLSSEHILGLCAEENTGNESPIVASKFELGVGLPRMGSRAVIRAVKRSCDRLETSCIDLYQVQANPWLYVGGGRALADGLAYAVDRGLCSYVGVCNMSARGMKSMQRKLDRRGVQLASNQFEFSLTNRDALLDGRIQACKDLGVVPIAHTPLDGGLATGKFTALNPTGGVVGVKARYDFQTLDPLSPVHETQDKVAQLVRTRLLKEFNDEKEMRLRNYKRKPMEGDFNRVVTSTQVAINYVVAKGAVPIPGINNLKEAEELLGCLGWSLTDHEVAMLDDAADTARRNRSLSTTPKKRNPFFSSRKNPRLLDF